MKKPWKERLPAILAICTLATTSCGGRPTPQTAVNRDTLTEAKIQELIAEVVEAFNRADYDGVMALSAPHFTHEMTCTDGIVTVRNREEYAAYLRDQAALGDPITVEARTVSITIQEDGRSAVVDLTAVETVRAETGAEHYPSKARFYVSNIDGEPFVSKVTLKCRP